MVEMRGICKRYGGVHALQGADFTAYPQEIHALVGDNAAGKSSLIKALSGAAPLDEGEIYFDGKCVQIGAPRNAKALGIETVYQDLALADNLDIPSNIFLGRELMGRGILRPFLDLRRMEKEAGELLRWVVSSTMTRFRSSGSRSSREAPTTSFWSRGMGMFSRRKD